MERRDYLTHPQVAKKESEVYDLIMAWEREVREQEKSTPIEHRPLLSPVVKMAVIKKISTGAIREHIKINEAIKGYDELRSEALTMAMFSKVENNKRASAGPAPMDVDGHGAGDGMEWDTAATLLPQEVAANEDKKYIICLFQKN